MKARKRSVYHTHAAPGKRIRVFLQDGTFFIDKFTNYPRGNTYEFEEHGKFKKSQVLKVELYGIAREVDTALIRVNRAMRNKRSQSIHTK